MSRARRIRIVGILMASLLGGVVTLAACSNQAEGERCQAENGNDDCQSGLVCLAATQKTFNGGQGLVNAPYNNSDRCCPYERSTASHPACVLLQTTITGDGAAPPADTGPTPDATTDSSQADTSTVDAADAADAADGD
ncbi:MAG TPA: hypothetical protein VLT33_23775 [Labilithrix sp.]|nr:hypothetical protein [Labilithrix sp.]